MSRFAARKANVNKQVKSLHGLLRVCFALRNLTWSISHKWYLILLPKLPFYPSKRHIPMNFRYGLPPPPTPHPLHTHAHGSPCPKPHYCSQLDSTNFFFLFFFLCCSSLYLCRNKLKSLTKQAEFLRGVTSDFSLIPVPGSPKHVQDAVPRVLNNCKHKVQLEYPGINSTTHFTITNL